MTIVNDFSQLSKYQERTFVPMGADFENKDVVVELFQKLINQEILSSEALEQWLLSRSELAAVLDQVGSIIYIKMTCQTDHQEYSDAYKRFIEQMIPSVSPLEQELNEKYLTLAKTYPLDQQRYEVYFRKMSIDRDLYRAENIPLFTKGQLLAQDYQTISGGILVSFQGEELTLPQMSKYLLDPDDETRKKAWQAMVERRHQDGPQFEGILDKMIQIRHQIAKNASYFNFCEYQFQAYHRFDYTSKECKQYHQVIAEFVVPVWKKILQRRQEQMKLTRLRPWDLQVDPLGRPALKPFDHVEELIEGVQQIFDKVDKSLGEQFKNIARKGLLDLASRKGKAPGGYQNTLAEIRMPFIFMNAVGVDGDIRTLLHEGGHAFHALASAHDPLYTYRHAPIEFCEVASMSMELLGGEHLSVFYNSEDNERSRRSHLEGIIQVLIWVANIDAFQHWLYENPQHTPKDRKKVWLDFYNQFGGDYIDWHGLENFRDIIWHRQLHIFEVPLYYIEYGIAQLGALQIWLNTKNNYNQGIEKYKNALALGGSRPLPELFEAADLKFDFSGQTIKPLVKAIENELGLDE